MTNDKLQRREWFLKFAGSGGMWRGWLAPWKFAWGGSRRRGGGGEEEGRRRGGGGEEEGRAGRRLCRLSVAAVGFPLSERSGFDFKSSSAAVQVGNLAHCEFFLGVR
jgi:hypothetical protein